MKKFSSLVIIVCLLAVGIYFWNHPYQISALGLFTKYALDEVEPSKKEVRMVAVGDSLSFGVGDEGDHGYVGDTKRFYEEKCDCNTVLKNYGVPNATSHHLLKRLKEENIQRSITQANIVFVNIGTNDFIKSSDNMTDPHSKEVNKGKEQYSNNLQHVISEIRKQNKAVPIYFIGLYDPYIEQDRKHLSSFIHEWNTLVQQSASSDQNVHYVKTEDLFENKDKQRYFSDSLHPNERGYNLIAERIVSTIKDVRSSS
ncbi:GDSL-type esterase/lipase family protein [Metabacillus iocasae]|uniref:Lysophospholipase L1-like esterase n=1 Tax=Priestia iocasae TaxID=2291674 RepID=A0ABS2QTE1_9BACI|nr:GDSL-type esterase/lipase family protein [Metabacillus iocasae]MBM7702731.1 lysophospholipase L1-like esterase [Metabacillus iocasae]